MTASRLTELRKETIEKLTTLKDDLSYDDERNYQEMVNILIDYDNEAQDNLYLYDTCHQIIEFLDDESLQYYVDYQIKTFGQDRYFYMFNGVHHPSGIYVIDGYGNLRDVEQSDFEYCIDEIIEKIQDELGAENEKDN